MTHQTFRTLVGTATRIEDVVEQLRRSDDKHLVLDSEDIRLVCDTLLRIAKEPIPDAAPTFYRV